MSRTNSFSRIQPGQLVKKSFRRSRKRPVTVRKWKEADVSINVEVVAERINEFGCKRLSTAMFIQKTLATILYSRPTDNPHDVPHTS